VTDTPSEEATLCGGFGFVSRDGGTLNVELLVQIPEVTERRVSDHLGLLQMAADARMLIGHCRWATQGDPADNINNHPHAADGGWIVHKRPGRVSREPSRSPKKTVRCVRPLSVSC
jgi:hypothetical protein